MPWHHKLHRGGNRIKTLADIGSGAGAGIAALSEDLTINSITVSPTFRYEAKNASLSAWSATVGEDLTAAGSGGTVGLDTPLPGITDEAVNPAGTRRWEAPSSFVTGLRDIVIEAVVQYTSTSTAYIASTRASSKGWYIREHLGNGYFAFGVVGDTGGTNQITNPALVDGAFYHLMWFADASGSIQGYVNGDARGSPSSMASVGNIVDDGPIVLGSTTAGAIPYDKSIVYVGCWMQTDWLDTHLQSDIAQARLHELTGVYSSSLSTGPTQTNLRNSIATLEKQGNTGYQRLFTVGNRWPRIETRPDRYNRYASGVHIEKQHTNLLLRSQELDNASWLTAFSTVSADTITAPDGTVTGDTLQEDGTVGQRHGRQQIVTQAAATYNMSVFIKPANRHWVRLFWSSSTDGQAHAYFDVASGVLGETSNADASSIRYMGDGWYRCAMTVTRSTAEAATLIIYIAEADGDDIFTGLTQDSLYVWGAQVTATAYPVSYIATSGTTVTRLADVLMYASTLRAPLTIAVDSLEYPASGGSWGWASVSDGTNNNRLQVYGSNLSSIVYNVTGGAAQALLTVGPRTERVWKEYRGTFETDDTRKYINGVLTEDDTSGSVPSVDLTQFVVGGFVGGGNQADGLVRARLFSKPTDKNITDFGAIMASASGYVSTPAGVSVSTSYVNIGGTWTTVNLSEFTLSAAGVFTYTGTDTKRFHFAAAISGSKSGGGATEITTALEKNGADITASEITRDVTGSTIGAWSVIVDVELANGDTLNLATKLDTGTETITIDKCSVVIEELS